MKQYSSLCCFSCVYLKFLVKSHGDIFKEKFRNVRDDQIRAVNKLYIKLVVHGGTNYFGVKELDPFLASTLSDYKTRKQKMKNKIRSDGCRKKPIIEVSEYIEKQFLSSSQVKQRRILSMLQFDCKNAQIEWFHCGVCMGRFLEEKYRNGTVCKKCLQRKDSKDGRRNHLLKNNYLPVWKDDDDVIRYDIPSQLQELTLGEKLIIQKYSAILPLVHIYKGRLGNRGNSVSFNKDLDNTCDVLPRLRADIIIVVKQYIDGKTSILKSQQFKIRREKVINALKWLKKHHVGYKDVTIKESNLDWVGETGVGHLDKDQVRCYESQTFHEEKGNRKELDSVAKSQTEVEVEQNEDDEDIICHNGLTMERSNDTQNDNDRHLLNDLRRATREKVGMDIDTMEFPHVSEIPINEFEETHLFANSYPWLFPGGIGDKSQSLCGKSSETDIKLWIQTLMRWHDGRFMRDDMFSFHLHNFRQRQMNNTSGLVFVKNFINDSSITVDQIKDQIESGDKSFLSKLQYFAGQRIRGSDPFWRKVKHEVDEWITYHLDNGHGPPTLFLTFSCAEYWWEDLEKVLFERCQGTEDEEIAKQMVDGHSSEKRKMTAKSILVERYSAVVQEFFQVKMDNWLKTVGKDEFGIKYHWMRFEFAKGRGTIHAHLLAITKDSHIVKQFYDAKSKQDKTYVIADYARNILDMSAEKPQSNELTAATRTKNPLATPYHKIVNDNGDKARLVEAVHMHECGKFCMRYPRLG